MSGAAIDDGGPAFPVKVGRDALPLQVSNDQFIMPGMSLRDYFATKAMQGILAGDHPITHELNACDTVTSVAYEFADAMLKARQS